MPATDLTYPALTVCNPHPYDVGEYMRAIYDNFQYDCFLDNPRSCEPAKLLREHFPKFFTYDPAKDWERTNINKDTWIEKYNANLKEWGDHWAKSLLDTEFQNSKCIFFLY